MRITILTLGSQGDVRPYIALGAGLQRAGHRVTIAASQAFAPLVHDHGLGFALMRFDPREFLASPQAIALLNSPYAILRFRELQRLVEPMFAAILEDAWVACADTKGILASGTSYSALECAEAHSVPLALGLLQPLRQTAAFPSFALPPRLRLDPRLNRATHRLFELIFWQSFRAPLNRWRRTIGRGPIPPNITPFHRMRTAGVPWLFGYSTHVLPRPDDWGADCHVTGYWFLDPPSDWRPPPALEAFLAEGPPPIAIGFGSMTQGDRQQLATLVLDAIRLSGQRAVLLGGWAGLGMGQLPAQVFAANAVPHSWLFPRVAVAVHHGGAGTTGASLRAGRPTVITPFLFDQHAWAELVATRGLGPRAAPIAQISAAQLAQAILTAVEDTAIRQRAAALGAAIRAEDGIGHAVGVIERQFR